MSNSAIHLKDMPLPLEQAYISLDSVGEYLSDIKSADMDECRDLVEHVSAIVEHIAVDEDLAGFRAIKEAIADIIDIMEKIRNQEIFPNKALCDALISLVTEIKAMIRDYLTKSLQEAQQKHATFFCKLAHHYHTDKAPGIAGHSYTPIYDQLFGPTRHNVTKVLEIGIGPTIYKNPRRVIAGPPPNPFDPDLVQISGASLRTLAAYFPTAQVYGIDIVPSLLFEDSRIKTFLCDQSSEEQLCRLAGEYGPFDIIIDDGSHLPTHQILTFFTLFNFVRPGGYYLVEDVSAKGLFGDPFYHPSEEICRITDPITRDKVFRQVRFCANFSLNGYGYGYQNSADDHLVVFRKYDQPQ